MWSRATQTVRSAYARDPQLLRVRVGLCLLLLWAILRLSVGDDPWTGGIAEREADGHAPRPIDYVETWGWWTAAAIAPVLLLLLATARRWLSAGKTPGDPAWAPRRPSRAFLLGTAAAILVGAALAAPRLDQSLFEDERITVRDVIDGAYYQDGQGNIRFIEKRWRDTIWWYAKPNNHIVQSFLSRASLSTYRVFATPESRLVNETALRLPCLLAGLGSIGAAAFLLLRLGYPAAGVLAAWILALHPWHMRYATEARGYSVMLMLGTLSLLALLAAMHRGSWRRWSWYGVLQFLLVLNYPLIGPSVALVNAVAVALLWRSHGSGPDFRIQRTRLFIVCLGGALFWVQLMTGNIVQLLEYLAHEHNEVVDGSWFRDLGAYVLSGTAWGHARPNAQSWELSDFAARSPALFGLAAVAALTLLSAGIARLVRSGADHAWIALLLVAPPVITLTLALATGTFLFPHYLIFGLTGIAILVALGVDGVTASANSRVRVAAGAAFLVAFGVFTQSPRAQLQARTIQPFRDSVELTRPNANPEMRSNRRIITVSFNWAPWYYDPSVKRIGDLKGLERWMQQADAEDRPLYVNVGRPKIALKRHPNIALVVGDERMFEEVAYFPGLLSRGSRQVWRYRTASERRPIR